MVLPLLLGLTGGALGGAGMIGGLGALAGSAIGSGLGTLAETGDLEKGIMSGLGSYAGGAVLGRVAGAVGGNGGGIMNLIGGNPAGQAAAGQAAAGGVAGQAAAQTAGMAAPQLAPAGSNALGFGMKQGMQGITGIPEMTMAQRAGTGVGNLMTPQVIGSQLGNLAGANASRMTMPDKDDVKYRRAGTPARISARPPSDYRPGRDPEFDYRVPGNLRRMADGGIAALAPPENRDDKKLISSAISAIRGEIQDPRPILGAFLQRYGEDALRELVTRVRRGDHDRNRSGEGMMRGVGDGTDDMIPASIEGQQDVVMSDGEFVVPADVVSGIGNGSSEAGAQKLYDLLERVRSIKTGSPEMPENVDERQVMPA